MFGVRHDSVGLSNLFQVKGFNVPRRVPNAINEKPVKDAEVDVRKGQSSKTIRTSSSDVYHLENGLRDFRAYLFAVSVTQLRFKPVNLKIRPASQQLKDITAIEVCGDPKFILNPLIIKISRAGFSEVLIKSDSSDSVFPRTWLL